MTYFEKNILQLESDVKSAIIADMSNKWWNPDKPKLKHVSVGEDMYFNPNNLMYYGYVSKDDFKKCKSLQQLESLVDTQLDALRWGPFQELQQKTDTMATKNKNQKPTLVTPAITEEERIIADLRLQAEKIRSEIDDLQATKKSMNKQLSEIRDKSNAFESECVEYEKQIRLAKETLKELKESSEELQAIWEAGTKKMDFVLPDQYTENVYDVTAYASREYNNITFHLVLNKEVTTKRMFGKRQKHVFSQDVKLFTIAKTDAWESSVEWGRTLAYLAAIRKKICAKNHVMDNSTLLSQADDALLTPDIHAKDAFILKLIDQLKNGN